MVQGCRDNNHQSREGGGSQGRISFREGTMMQRPQEHTDFESTWTKKEHGGCSFEYK